MRLFLKIFLVVVVCHLLWNFRSCSYGALKPIFSERITKEAILKVERNYGQEVEKICEELGVPAAYFKALILLECSAQNPPRSRYEPGVFKKLQAVKNGKLQHYNGLTQKDLTHYSDQELTMLATSWGALQIMGYHVVKKGLTIDDLNGKNGLRVAIEWCLDNYGEYVRNKDYKNAFHIHNTGRKHPLLLQAQTYDPLYVDKGLIYVQALE